jgi:hypothetical protein
MRTAFVLLLSALGLSACTTGSLFRYTVFGSPQGVTRDAFRLDLPWLADGALRAGSPSSLKIAIFAYYLSTGADCANPVPLIDYGGDPLIKDVYANPTLFSGNPGEGNYRCVVLKIRDTLRFRPDETAATGACGTTESEHTYDLYRSDQMAGGTWKNLEGQQVTAKGALASPEADVVTLFASTDPDEAIAARQLSPSQIIPLAAPIQVPGETTFYADYENGVLEDSGVCTLADGLLLGVR